MEIKFVHTKKMGKNGSIYGGYYQTTYKGKIYKARTEYDLLKKVGRANA